MMKRFAVAALAALFLAGASTAPVFAQATQPAAKPAAKPKAAKKPPSAKQLAQRQKMRDCSAKWKASGEKGRAAQRKFMSTCLKAS
jgi:hypothetical protein